MAREIAARAAAHESGSHIKTRLNGEILIYWQPDGAPRGMFMVIRPTEDGRGEVVTLFSPAEGKRYFDGQSDLFEPSSPTRH
ncbi:MAG: hypothetical protein IT167_28315 [Bryobacterales bacterium]|nr:hypothetical protein [Bryobacterales bacterium]